MGTRDQRRGGRKPLLSASWLVRYSCHGHAVKKSLHDHGLAQPHYGLASPGRTGDSPAPLSDANSTPQCKPPAFPVHVLQTSLCPAQAHPANAETPCVLLPAGSMPTLPASWPVTVTLTPSLSRARSHSHAIEQRRINKLASTHGKYSAGSSIRLVRSSLHAWR